MSGYVRTTVRTRYHGVLMADVIFGLVLVMAIGTAVLVASNRSSRAQQRLSDARAAQRAAERVLVAMQTGTALPPAEEAVVLAVRQLDGGVNQRVWVRVEASVNGRPATLVGLVSSTSVETARNAYPGGNKP